MSSDNEGEIKKLANELLRRELVSRIREKGTIIRLKEIERQRITVKLNKPQITQLIKHTTKILEFFDNIIVKFIEKSSDILDKERISSVNITSEEDLNKLIDILSQTSQKLLTYIIKSYNDIVMKYIGYDLYETPKTLLNEVNEQIKIANEIIEELKKEGILVSCFDEFPITDNIIENYSNLNKALTVLETINEIYSIILDIDKDKVL
jgi:hypothetical protein